MTFFNTFVAHARKYPERICIKTPDSALTWAELVSGAVNCSGALARVGPGKTAALRLRDPLETMICVAALLHRGITAILIPHSLNLKTMARIVDSAKPDYLVMDDWTNEEPGLGSSVTFRTVHVRELLSSRPLPNRSRSEAEGLQPTHDATVLYSSGSTSEPKGVVHTATARLICAKRLAAAYGFSPSSTSLVTAGLPSGGLQPALAMLYAGGTTVLFPTFRTSTFLSAAKAATGASFNLTPSQFSMLLDDPSFDIGAFAGCTYVQCGGAPLHAGQRSILYELFPGKFVEGYGSTETDLISRLPRRAPLAKRGSVGVPRASVTVKIVSESMEPVGPSETGEILVHSEGNFRQYLGANSDDSSFWFDGENGAKYFRTGDLGLLDDDGYLWLRGRRKQIIISAGVKIHPSDIEAILLSHPAVSDAAVVGIAHAILGETPVGFVVLRQSHDERVDSSQICRWANNLLNANQRLFEVRLIDSFPKTSTGKVRKEELRQRFCPSVSTDSP